MRMRRLGTGIVVLGLLGSGWPSAAVGQDDGDPGGLTLVDAARRALAEYPTVRAARARAEAAGAAARQARADWLPDLSLAGSITRYEEPMIVTPIHGFTPGATPPFDETLIQGSVNLEYTLFEGGGRGARVRRSSTLADAAEAGLAAREQAVVGQVVATYLKALSLHGVLDAHDRQVAALDAEVDRTRQLLEVGRAARVEVLRAEAARATARAERVRTATALDVARRDLARLIGAPAADVDVDRLVPVSFTEAELPERDVLVDEALRTSPAVRRADRELVSAEAAADLARSARWPSLRLTGAFVDRGSADGSFTGEWNLGARLSYSLFTGNRVSASIARAEADHRAAAEDLRLARSRVAEAVDRAVSAIEESRARALSLTTAVDRSAEVVRIEQLRLDAGSGTQTDYLSAEAELRIATAGLVEARHAEAAARAELARAVGALTLEWLRLNLERR